MLKIKRIATIAITAAMAMSVASVCVNAVGTNSNLSTLSNNGIDATGVGSNYKTITGSSEFDANIGIDDSWTRTVADIYLDGIYLGDITGLYFDNIITDEVQTRVSASHGFSRCAIIISGSNVDNTGYVDADYVANTLRVSLSGNSVTFRGSIIAP